MQKTLLGILLAALIAGPFAAFANVSVVHAATFNTAIRGTSNSTVYWYANDGKRYVFPNAATYYTWFNNFDNVLSISDSELFSIPLAGNVTYRPGAKLVKVTTDPKTYAVARGGILRHVTSESLANQLYGFNWASKVQDLPDELFTNYTVDSPIYSTSDYNVSNEYSSVFSPSDSLRIQGQGSTGSGSLTLAADRTSITRGQAVALMASYNGTLPSGGRLEIKRDRSNEVVHSCYNNICSITVYPYQTAGINTTQYYVSVLNASGNVIAGVQYGPVITFTSTGTGSSNDGVNYIDGLTLQSDRTSATNGDMMKLTANAYNSGNWSYTGNRIEIRDIRTGSIVRTCYDQSWCVADISVMGNNGTAQYEVRIYDRNSNFIMSQFGPVISVSGSNNNNNNNNGSVGQIPNTDIYIAPSTNVRSGGTVYLTASFTNLPYTSSNTVIRLYTEQSSTPVGTCSGSDSCSVPYTISNSGVNTRVYGVASNSTLANTVETARIPLATF